MRPTDRAGRAVGRALEFGPVVRKGVNTTQTTEKPSAAAIDPRNPEHATLLREELVKVFPAAGRYLYPAVDYWGGKFADRHCWAGADGSRGCWLAHCQSAWTDDSWGWQSVEPNAAQQRSMTCRRCEVGGWFVFDVASIGD